MERVTGIGGMFFRAEEPKSLAAWYEQHLGVRRVGELYEDGAWWQDEGPTVFTPLANDTEYFGRPEQMWMLNFRVEDLDAMVNQLREAKIEVEIDPETHPNGRFARLNDPEGNPIQLWQPGGTEPKRPAGI